MAISNSALDTRFRSALERMAERGRLQAYRAPADPHLEIAGMMKKLDGGPAVLFSDVIGHDVPVVGNLLSCQANCEAAFGTDFRSMGNGRCTRFKLKDVLEAFIRPPFEASGHCQLR